VKASKPVLNRPVRSLARSLVNTTPDGDVGYDLAVQGLSDQWPAFLEAGAGIADMEQITGFIRWAKFEGFCQSSPMT
jgi:hypothetical protein